MLRTPSPTEIPRVDLDELGAESYNRKTSAPPEFQRFTSDCRGLVFWTGRTRTRTRTRLERIGVMVNRK